MPEPPLSRLRVVDLSTWIAGAYCTKLLADAGAEVIKVEAAGGDPLRRWSASGSDIPVGADGALFNFLAASKHSVVPDADLDDLLASADVAVCSAPNELRHTHPHLVVTSITPFGLEGPWRDRAATEFTLQAWSGGIVGLARGLPERAPVHVGGQIGEWLAGAFAAAGTLAAVRHGRAGGELVDVSMLESLAMGLTYYPVTFHDQLGRPMRKKRFIPSPGVESAKDGLVGLGLGTGQQWLDFCVMVGHPEWTDDPKLFLDRSTIAPIITAWMADHSVAEIMELAAAFRLPNAPIVDGANATTFDHFQARDTFTTNPRDGATNPRPPFRITSVEPRRPAPAPRLGEHAFGPRPARADRPPRPVHPARSAPEPARSRPLEGLRVVDMTAFWAGPFTGHMLALLGAEVIHLEAASRPDGARLVGGVPPTEDRYWERGPIFAALNTNKQSVTIDFRTERGVALVRRLIATCDVVIENYTPRVLDQAGLDYETLRADHPGLVMVRMPGFGLDGPWRDQAAFAFVIEDASGLTTLTGHPDLLPFEPYCVGDPNAGLHALIGLMVALEQRDQTGQGALVEAAMVDAALNVAAEQVIEYSAYGARLARDGNRGPMATPQNLYHAAGPDESGRDDSWVAIAVADDDQWSALRKAIGEPEWAQDDDLATASGRRAAHDRIDEHLGEWCRARPADEIVELLWPAGVPVGKVMPPHFQPDLEQLQARRFFEELDHPVTGPSRYSTLPMRFASGPDRLHQTPAPLLGQHTTGVLLSLGLTQAEIDELEAAGIVGGSLQA